jgi:hypothetical protein
MFLPCIIDGVYQHSVYGIFWTKEEELDCVGYKHAHDIYRCMVYV